MMTEKIGAEGKIWMREFPVYLTSHTPGKQNIQKYLDLKNKGAKPNVLRTRRTKKKYPKR